MREEENVFEMVDKEPKPSPMRVKPKIGIRKVLKQERKNAESDYEKSFVSSNKAMEEAEKKYKAAIEKEKRYKEFKRDKLDRKLAPVKSAFTALGNLGAKLKKRTKPARGVFVGFGQQSKGPQWVDYSNSPFRK